MAARTRKNYFEGPEQVEHTIRDPDNKIIGRIQLKPSGVLWKNRGAVALSGPRT